VAATVAGVLSLEDAMALVMCQARLLSQQAMGGGMLTVMAPVAHFESHPQLYQGSTLASINFPGNFVVSADQATLQAIKQQLDTQDVAALLLPVDHGFHSTQVDPIKTQFLQFVQTLARKSPGVPLYSAMLGDAVTAFDDQYFWDVLRQRVDFHKLIGSLNEQDGVHFVDLGPTGTLASFIKYGFGNQIDHAVSINQFGKNLETVSKLLTKLSD
jgi:acyl transferase domain-containing protein